MSFRVGQKVVFVGWAPPWYLRWAVNVGSLQIFSEDRVYTVSAVYDHGFARKAIDLVEMPWRPLTKFSLPGWVAYAFRPVVEDTDKLEWARKLLEPKALAKFKRKERVEA